MKTVENRREYDEGKEGSEERGGREDGSWEENGVNRIVGKKDR